MLNRISLLKCGCEFDCQMAPVKVNQEVTCRRHGPQRVEHVSVGEWIADCNMCAWQKHCGAGGKLTSEIAASKHRKLRTTHHVTVYTPEGSVHRVFDGGGQLTLGE